MSEPENNKVEKGEFILIPDHPIILPPMGYCNSQFNLNNMTADVRIYNEKDELIETIKCIVLIEKNPS